MQKKDVNLVICQFLEQLRNLVIFIDNLGIEFLLHIGHIFVRELALADRLKRVFLVVFRQVGVSDEGAEKNPVHDQQILLVFFVGLGVDFVFGGCYELVKFILPNLGKLIKIHEKPSIDDSNVFVIQWRVSELLQMAVKMANIPSEMLIKLFFHH